MSTAAGGLIAPAAMHQYLEGRSAVVGIEVEHEGGRDLHALAWTGSQLFDCRGPEVLELDIIRTSILGAAVITRC